MLILAYVVAVLLMILLPVALAAWLRRTAISPWLLFGLGCLTFALSQLAHFPLNDWLAGIGFLPGEKVPELPLWRWGLTLGLTAGLCEELARAAGYFALLRFKPAWLRLNDSLMLGLGHGGFESMVFGGVMVAAAFSALMPLRGADLTQMGISPDQQEAVRMQLEAFTGSPWAAFAPVLERLIAMGAHLTFSLMVWKAFTRRSLRKDWHYILLAIVYHAAVDFYAVWASRSFTGQHWLSLLGLVAALLPGWIWAAWTIRQTKLADRPAQGKVALRRKSALGLELGVFWTATLKELRQAWSTRRLLVVWAVFLIFGMVSPLLAKFTPEMLKAIEGAEMFADLIPKPTILDAITQYLKNISQFGFLLAVLLGMGAVVGEKERGVAPMVLSKPLPRWAFIASKFSAQILMYASGFVLSGLGAYYYTLFIFAPLDFGKFALLNGLLLLWLLSFVGLSLLASTLAGSTAAAGGIGLAFSIVLMLAGNLPGAGMLLPGGLMGWATLVGQGAAGVAPPGQAEAVMAGPVAQGGAAASAVVILVMALVLAVGVFEQQEL